MNNNKNKATKQFPIVSISRDLLRDIFDPQEDPKAHNRVESLTDEDMEDLAREMRFPCTPKSFVDVLGDLFESMFLVGETEEGNKSKKPTCPKCGKQITWLKNWQSGKEGWEFSLDKDNDPDYPQQIPFTGDNNTNDYDCPECKLILFTTEEEATAFLKERQSNKQLKMKANVIIGTHSGIIEDVETEEGNKSKKPTCPECGKKVDSLDWRSQLPATSFSIDNDGDPDYHDFQVSISDTEVSFSCPICNKILFTNEEEATAFLKGETKQ